ncbi:MAG TPA: hypothetical protein VHG69_07690 [Thermoleophilaceae bacterium]|nr:hypothetical protein [Thermoleophilaceae bacterium]
MRFIHASRPAPPTRPVGAGERLVVLADRADGLAARLAERPWRSLGLVLALNASLAACFLAGGLALGDQAGLFREATPGTFLSCAALLLIAATARAVHLRELPGEPLRRGFFGLAAVAFAVFAFDEITQGATFLGGLLHHEAGLRPAEGFHDLEAVLLTLLFATTALILLPRSLALLRHPHALAPLAAGVALGAASQTLDSFAPPTRWEFVAEEMLKLGAEAMLLGAFLVALNGALRAGAGPPARKLPPEPRR